MSNKSFFFCPKLGQVSNPQWLTYTQILVEYPLPWGEPGGGGAETDTILKIKNPPGGGETLEQERSHDCDKSSTERDITQGRI